MGRNKDIKSLKFVSGCRYSYLRKVLKKHNWNYWGAYAEVQYTLANYIISFDGLVDSIHRFGELSKETSKAFEKFRETIKPLKEKGVI